MCSALYSLESFSVVKFLVRLVSLVCVYLAYSMMIYLVSTLLGVNDEVGLQICHYYEGPFPIQ
jgi:uncharacterized membrane protein